VGLGALVGVADYFLIKDTKGTIHKQASIISERYERINGYGISLDSSFEDYVAYYTKSYDDVEVYEERKRLFEASKAEIRRIQELDGPNSTYTMELNEFADLTEKEFKKYWTGAKHLDEREDTISTFYDIENEMVIDNVFIQEYLDRMDNDPSFHGDHGSLDETIKEIVPDNHYSEIGDEALVNPYDQIGELSWDEATKNIKDLDHEKEIRNSGQIPYDTLD
jgi:hypothetical protein